MPFTVWKVSFLTEDGCGIWVRMGTLSLRFAVLGWLTAGVRMSRRDKNKCGQASWWDYWCSLRVQNGTCQTWGKWGKKNAVQGVKPNSPSATSPLQSRFIFNYTNVPPLSVLSLGCRLDLVFCQNSCQKHNITGALLLLSFSQGATVRWFFHPLESDKPKVEGNKE